MKSACILSPGVDWRIYELELFQKYFGECRTVRPVPEALLGVMAEPDVKTIFWKLASESIDIRILSHSRSASVLFQYACKQINRPTGWMAVHCKEKAFETWRQNGIPQPSWYDGQLYGGFLPCLVRFNNSTGGRYTYFCRTADAARAAYQLLESQMEERQGVPPTTGIGRRIICVGYYDTGEDRYNMSFRIIVAGNRIVAGYARISPKDDWCCITKKFEPWMQDIFIKVQQKCQAWCEQNEALVVKAVRCLGLNFQGVDVILEREMGRPIFLEVQPGFSVGYANRPGWEPPYYNPSAPKELVKWLKNDEKTLRPLMPWYYEKWLDKRAMFDDAFRYLKESFNEETRN